MLAPADDGAPFCQHHHILFASSNVYSTAVLCNLACHRPGERPRVCLHVVAVSELIVCALPKGPDLSCAGDCKAAIAARCHLPH